LGSTGHTDRNPRLVYAPGGPIRPIIVQVVEDQPGQQIALRMALEAQGYGVGVAATGVEALEMAGLTEPDLVLLDLGLPDLDGLEVLAALRRVTRCPVIVLTADSLDERIVQALDGGADDYILKPVSSDVLLARVRVSLRHAAAVAPLVETQTLDCGDVHVDLAAHQVTIGGDPVELLPKQFDLLVMLMRNEGRLLTHTALIRVLWGSDPRHDEVYNLRTSVSKLRKVLGTGPHRPAVLTEKRAGYRFVPPAG
jgi:two-component system, OmpR family, KDP operon response regulator KdpE